MKKLSGAAAFPVIAGIALVAVGVAVGVGGTLLYMKHHSGGLGGAEKTVEVIQTATETIPESVELPTETIPETTEPETTEPETEPVTESGTFLEITVSGNDYFYQEEVYTLEEISGLLSRNSHLSVKIIDDRASKRAYDALTAVIQENDVSMIVE